MEQDEEVIIVEECQSEDTGSLVACGEKDLCSQEEDISNSQLATLINAQTKKDIPMVLAFFWDIEDALLPVQLDSSEEVETPSRNPWTSKQRDQLSMFTFLILNSIFPGKSLGRGSCNRSPTIISNIQFLASDFY